MNGLIEISAGHGGILLFLVVLLEQTGLPIPAAPCLLAAGTLCATGASSLTMVIGTTALACLIPDLAWF
jgi:membrane protein DedA with SNARE-associated domain